MHLSFALLFLFFSRRAKLKKRKGEKTAGAENCSVFCFIALGGDGGGKFFCKRKCAKTVGFFLRQKEENVGHFYLFYICGKLNPLWYCGHFESVAVSVEFPPAWLRCRQLASSGRWRRKKKKKRFIIITFPNVAIWQSRWGFFSPKNKTSQLPTPKQGIRLVLLFLQQNAPADRTKWLRDPIKKRGNFDDPRFPERRPSIGERKNKRGAIKKERGRVVVSKWSRSSLLGFLELFSKIRETLVPSATK